MLFIEQHFFAHIHMGLMIFFSSISALKRLFDNGMKVQKQLHRVLC
jgi:hypothetical protein